MKSEPMPESAPPAVAPALYPMARPAYGPHQPDGLAEALDRFDTAAATYLSGRPAAAAAQFLATADDLRRAVPEEVGLRTVAYWNALVSMAAAADVGAAHASRRAVAADDPACAAAVAQVADGLFGRSPPSAAG